MPRELYGKSGAKLVIWNILDIAASEGRFPVDIPQSVASGLALLCSRPLAEAEEIAGAHLGVDALRLAPDQSFPLHTHPGHHLLLIIKGNGTVTYDGETYLTSPGDLYIMDGGVEHAVGAIDEHTLLAFGAPHVHVDDPRRMTVVELERAGAGGD